ncbi:TetR/AcrR family transcriptional regulator [Conexibacter woesei]|uniref:Transcriptional regulator, TetR family n=1 Tax=Conexibacter woesei (strain DSM 14684 / CCUG 47730 / CIP 108061 / JCM 11494 / NBRC 100937 / ID131577) TaxID=469383 RepID=D3FEN2_CONWI|nr:TetR/AcrR family transcriptional regulator [Conexibacter woesei]ADB49706.1 transcriptional regulator, TetR family [Conexibacter woesei DSM 14684]
MPAAGQATGQAAATAAADATTAASASPATRDRILHATLRVVATDGIGAVTNRRVAAEAGVALGSLTYHFPSQTELLRDSLLRYVEEEVARLGAVAKRLRASDPTPEQVAIAVEQLIADDPARVVGEVAELELHLEASRDPALQDASGRCFAAYEDFAAAVMEVLGVPDPQVHARTVVALLIGLTVRRLGTGVHDARGTADALMTIVRGAHA